MDTPPCDPRLDRAWRQLPGEGPVTAACGLGWTMMVVMAYSACPSWRSAFSFPDDRQASDRSPTDAMAVPASSWTKDLCSSYEPSAPLLVPQIPHGCS